MPSPPPSEPVQQPASAPHPLAARTSDSPPPYEAVVFDCDSTLSAIEGVDELAAVLGPEARTAIERLTARAMSGELSLAEVYAPRLAAIRPNRAALDELGRAYVRHAVANAARVCRELAALGKEVHVVSGGLRPAVLAIAAACGVPDERVHAVEVRFDADGAFDGFDESSPLVQPLGKLDLLRALGLDRRRTALVGDGSTDLAAAPACARFIAFAGVARRAAVCEAAAVVVDAPDFEALLPALLTPAERQALDALRS